MIAWELGSGLGHLMQLAPLANALAARGHRVYAAVRDVGRAPLAFDPAVMLLQAPFGVAVARPRRPARTFAHVLADVGWDDERQLGARAEAWRNLFRLTSPDLIIFDHSPTALLAARGGAARRVTLGNGFVTPPDIYPLPDLWVWLKQDPGRFREDEDAVVALANSVLRPWGEAPLGRLGELYSEVDLTLLTLLPELDPYADRRPPGARYWGGVIPRGGKPPQWPNGRGKKVFVYLRECRATEAVLRRLLDRGASVIAMADPSSAGRLPDHPHLRIETERLDLSRLIAESDLGVLNANGVTSLALLLGGRPALHLPVYLEHMLTARCVRRLGAGLDAPARKPELVLERLDGLLDSDACAEGARRLARRYRDFDPSRAGEGMLRHCEALLAAGSPAPARR